MCLHVHFCIQVEELNITIITGSDPNAGTNATVTVQLIGDIGNVTLTFTAAEHPEAFYSDSSFNYIEEISDIGTLLKVIIGKF